MTVEVVEAIVSGIEELVMFGLLVAFILGMIGVFDKDN